MRDKYLISFLQEATYLDHIQISKKSRTTTIIDTRNNVEFSVTISSINSKEFHAYFIDENCKSWTSKFLNRAIFASLDFNKNELPDDWGQDDMLILSNKSSFTSTENVLVKAMNYFANQVDKKATAESGVYHRLYNQDSVSLN